MTSVPELPGSRFKLGGVLLGCASVIWVSTLAFAQPDSVRPFSPRSLESRLRAYVARAVHADSIISAANEAALIVQDLASMGVRATTQPVPSRSIQLDLTRATFRGDPGSGPSKYLGNPKFFLGFDYLPLVGLEHLSSARAANVKNARVVFGGRLGTPNLVAPHVVTQDIVLFLPPTRADGLPDYQFWRVSSQLAKYSDAAAILVASLDFMPAGVQADLAAPRLVGAANSRASPIDAPPVIAVSRALASMLLFLHVDGATPGYSAGVRASVEFRSVARNVSSGVHNVFAVIGGSDARLAREHVLLSARGNVGGASGASPTGGVDSARDGANASAGVVALLAIAEHVAAMPVKPKRSTAFLWTVGADRAGLGSSWYVEHPVVPHDRVVANVNLDVEITTAGNEGVAVPGALSSDFGGLIDSVRRLPEFGAAVYGADGSFEHQRRPPCGGDPWHLEQFGVPTVVVASDTAATLNRAEGGPRINFEHYASVVRLAAAIATRVADRPSRPLIDGRRLEIGSPCVR